jgi:hypothetical protein
MQPDRKPVRDALALFTTIETVATAIGRTKIAVTAHKHANACREILGEAPTGFDDIFEDIARKTYGDKKPAAVMSAGFALLISLRARRDPRGDRRRPRYARHT